MLSIVFVIMPQFFVLPYLYVHIDAFLQLHANYESQPDGTHLVTGLSDGMLSIRRRIVKMGEVSKQKAHRKTLRGGSYRYFLRGQHDQAKPVQLPH